jgi:hypothetical protein
MTGRNQKCIPFGDCLPRAIVIALELFLEFSCRVSVSKIMILTNGCAGQRRIVHPCRVRNASHLSVSEAVGDRARTMTRENEAS